MIDPQSIQRPDDIRRLPTVELTRLAAEIRRFLIEQISRTGGYIGANLGTVELTLALHKSFESPRESLVWDSGHQGCTHKILTGRAGLFPTLDCYGGMNRFVSRAESEHDVIEASHGGTSISVALGMALARRMEGRVDPVVAVIGDGALCEGMALEALNHAAAEDVRLVIVLNDNGFAISPGCGGLHEALQAGEARAGAFFRALGLEYVGPVDGHDVGALLVAFEDVRRAARVAVVHVKTEKGCGWAPAAEHPLRAHFSFPFDPKSGALREEPAGPSWAECAGHALEREMESDESIVAITPSTIHATGLAPIFARFPGRCFDPGMQEQHALTLSVGLALEGKKPVLAYQSTYLQRAFDQLLHDVCFMNQPTLLLVTCSGLAGYDNSTHHGIYDFAWMRGLPNLRVLQPKDRFELERMVRDELRALVGPVAILTPYGPAPAFDENVLAESRASFVRPQLCEYGRQVLFVAVGNRFADARAAVHELREAGVDAGLVNLRQLKPLPEDALAALLSTAERVVTVEEGVLDGGVGSAIASLILDRELATSLLRIGLPCTFVEPGSNEELCRIWGLDAGGILRKVAARWPELEPAVV